MFVEVDFTGVWFLCYGSRIQKHPNLKKVVLPSRGRCLAWLLLNNIVYLAQLLENTKCTSRFSSLGEFRFGSLLAGLRLCSPKTEDRSDSFLASQPYTNGEDHPFVTLHCRVSQAVSHIESELERHRYSTDGMGQ